MEALNEFEVAVLAQVAAAQKRYRGQINELIHSGRVENREWSGAGGFINFEPNSIQFEPPNLELDACANIRLPGLKHGLGAILFVRDGRADWLELYTYDDDWWGDWTGFRIVPGSEVGGLDAT